jgi:hypothetical protein
LRLHLLGCCFGRHSAVIIFKYQYLSGVFLYLYYDTLYTSGVFNFLYELRRTKIFTVDVGFGTLKSLYKELWKLYHEFL